MDIIITAVHMEGGTLHEHIASVKWAFPGSSDAKESSRSAIIEWMNTSVDNRAWVGTGSQAARVYVRQGNNGATWIQTAADGVWSNNLLSLPRF